MAIGSEQQPEDKVAVAEILVFLAVKHRLDVTVQRPHVVRVGLIEANRKLDEFTGLGSRYNFLKLHGELSVINS